MVKAKTDVANIIKKYAKALSLDIDVNKVVLVGPYAAGDVDEWSDIQFVVISKDFASMSHIKRLDILADKTLGIDTFLVPFGGYTPDEYEHPEKTLHMRWIKSAGKIVYEGK